MLDKPVREEHTKTSSDVHATTLNNHWSWTKTNSHSPSNIKRKQFIKKVVLLDTIKVFDAGNPMPRSKMPKSDRIMARKGPERAFWP